MSIYGPPHPPPPGPTPEEARAALALTAEPPMRASLRDLTLYALGAVGVAVAIGVLAPITPEGWPPMVVGLIAGVVVASIASLRNFARTVPRGFKALTTTVGLLVVLAAVAIGQHAAWSVAVRVLGGVALLAVAVVVVVALGARRR